jgi:hypothetical protein
VSDFAIYDGMLLFLTMTSGSRPTQPPTMWVPGAVSLDVKLTIHLLFSARSRIHWNISLRTIYVLVS